MTPPDDKSPDEKDEFNTDLNKFETRNEVVEWLLNSLARKIQEQLPQEMRFALFLLEEEGETANVFYCASARTTELLPLIRTWCERQVN